MSATSQDRQLTSRMTSNAFRAPLPPFVPGRTRSLPAQHATNVAPTPWEASAAARQAARRNAASMAELERDAGMQGWPVLGDEGPSGSAWRDDAAGNVNGKNGNDGHNGGGPGVAAAGPPAPALYEPAPGPGPTTTGSRGEADGDDAEFPLEAFFVPEHCTRMPAGYDPEVHRAISQQVAQQLDELAATIRSTGMHAIGATPSADELSRIVAAVVAGFYGRQSD